MQTNERFGTKLCIRTNLCSLKIQQTIRKSKVRPRKSKKIKTSLLQWIKHRKKSTCVCARAKPTLNRAIYVFLSSIQTHTITYVETEKRHTRTHRQTNRHRKKERKNDLFRKSLTLALCCAFHHLEHPEDSAREKENQFE